MTTAKRAAKIVAYVAVALVVMSAVTFLVSFAYHTPAVQKALSQAKRFITTRTRVQTREQLLRHIKPYPLSSPVHNRRFDEAIAGARAAYEAGQYDRAVALNTEALEMRPSQDLAWLLLTRRGDSYRKNGETDKALVDYDEAERIGGLDSDTYVNRALALRRAGRRDEAAQDFEAAIATEPDSDWTYFARAATFAQDNDLSRALADYAKALELNPKNVATRLAYAEILIRQNQNQEAITQSTMVLNFNSKWAPAYVTRAKAFARLSMVSKALADLDTATKVDSASKVSSLNSVAWCRATSAHKELRDGKRAVAEAMESCVLDHWKHWSYIDTLAAAYAEAGDFDHAAKYERLALKMIPGGAENIENCNARLGMYEHHQPYRDNSKGPL